MIYFLFLMNNCKKNNLNLQNKNFNQILIPYFTQKDDCKQVLMDLIKNGKKSIFFAYYKITDKKFISAFIKATKRGLKIEGIVDAASIANGDANIKQLKDNGIKVEVMNKSITGDIGLMHNKFIVIDEEIVVTGSMNLSYKVSEVNHENIIIINDKEIAGKYISEYKDLLDDAQIYKLDEV
jgi:phosphatidylserine/phosphatidylglycerophosphate/cardiolipin synthase-like enzyme